MTRLAIEKDRITIAALLIIVIGGAAAYLGLPQNEDPGFTVRTALVLTYFPGASPERVENLVTDRIEEVVQEIPELDSVQSESRTGVSIVFANISERYHEMRPIWDSLRRKIDRVRGDLPEGSIGPFVNDEFGDVYGILVTVTGEGFSYHDLEQITDEARDELLGLDDAAKVGVYGAQERRVFVEYNDARLAELGLSAAQLKQILESRNIIIPGGSVRVGRERVALEPSGNYETLDDLKQTVIRIPGRPDLVYLQDVADVSYGYVDPAQVRVRSSGTRALALGVSLRERGSVLRLGKAVKRKLAEFRSRYPIGVEFDVVAFQPQRVEQKVDDFVGNLLQAVAIVMLVMLLFLGLRTGLVVAALIPMAMLLTLLIMSFAGIGLDQMSLAALIIALGMLIDNAIVVSESILVQMGEGRAPLEAAVSTGNEMKVPLLTSSLTTAVAFLPFYLAKSSAGEYTGVIFLVVSIALISSWLLSLTMTPLLCVRFLRAPRSEQGEAFSGGLYRAYRAVLGLMLRRRWLTVAATLAFFAGTMATFPWVPKLFFPAGDRAFFTAQLYLPTGTAIETTDEVASRFERFLADELRASDGREEGVTNWAVFVGGGEPRYILNAKVEQNNPAYAFFLVNTTSWEIVPEMIRRAEDYCASNFPDVVATLNPSALGPPVDKPIQVRISGPDPGVLFGFADEVKQKVRSLAGTRNVDDDWGRRTKKLRVEINQPRARRAGVTSQDVAVSLQTTLSGIETTQLREGGDLVPVTLRSVAADRQDLGKIETLNVYSQATGAAVPLRQVADVRVAWEASKILRRDRRKTVTVEADTAAGTTASVVNASLVPWLEARSRDWPPAYSYELGGEIESSVKAQKSIEEKLPVAGLLILLLLVGQFNSFRRPLIILATIPLGLIGVVLGLHLFHSYFGFMTLLGIVSLSGIVINNAIVLLDRIRIEIDENGLDPRQAIPVAAQRRLRPILLTTLTTIGGLVPLYLGGGPMWEPMAVAIMCGLAFATALTLGFVPVLYAIMFRVRA
ncbi:MAG TPA: efflux RND transporter permease subunit [Candidatus Saccharimonadales bacterium]|nr:efflux RND transporter permease subunit [Candidatus Saccharimonadales bacterium]